MKPRIFLFLAVFIYGVDHKPHRLVRPPVIAAMEVNMRDN